MRTTKLDESLEHFIALSNHKIEHVIDVGVQWGTPFLMEYFPNSKHWLIEPVKEYHGKINERYNDIQYELLPFALSDSNGILFLHEYDYDQKGRVSHSHLRPNKVEGPYLIRISDIEVKTLDGLFVGKQFNDYEYVVKIDVDGLEAKIINGGNSVLAKASLIIVEAPLKFLHQRLGLLEELSFSLWDICDPAYYYDQLHQVDLVLINNEVKKSNIDFRPWEKNNGKLMRSKWQGR